MLVKVQFLRNGEPGGRKYTYVTSLDLRVGDLVIVPPSGSVAQVVELDVSVEEVAAFKDRLKRIDVKVVPKEESAEDKEADKLLSGESDGQKEEEDGQLCWN